MAISLNSELRLPCGAILPNRICKAAMTEGMADVYDHATPLHAQLYQTWSEGGAGLLITGNVMIDRRYLERPGNVVIENEEGLSALQRWAKAGTKAGNHLWMQISHPGRQCARVVSGQPVSASDVQLDLLGNFAKPRAMTTDEIEKAIRGYANTARIAQKAGFTGVQIHAAHGYLISQFLSPVTNRRFDEWGGALENRARFLLTVIKTVRDEVGEDFPIGVKLNSADFQKGGFTLEDSAQVAAWLSDAGVDLLEISGGTYEQFALLGHEGDPDQADNPEVRESTRQREAYFLKYANTIQDAISIPLMVTGGFRSRLTMVEAIEAGELDVIGLARPFCGDPGIAHYLLNASVTHAPAYETDLILGRGVFGPASPLKLFKLLNVQGEVAWFYRQMLYVANGQSPQRGIGILVALCLHLGREYRIAFRRKRLHKRQQSVG